MVKVWGLGFSIRETMLMLLRVGSRVSGLGLRFGALVFRVLRVRCFRALKELPNYG